jgi:hypothetical protein
VRPRGVVLAVAAAATVALGPGCRKDREKPSEIKAEIAALEKERDALREKIGELMVRDPRIKGMPDAPVRVGVPTSLTRTLVEKVVAGFVDQVTLELKNIRVRKSGTVKKVVTIGEYALDVRIEKVQGRLKTGRPNVTFGGNKIALAMPVTVASGSGRATIGFKWNGKNVSGAVCGDLDIEQPVSGSVKPDSYPVAGAIVLTAGAEQILAAPKFPVVKVNLKIDPSKESWAAVQKIVDDKQGACGFVLDKVDVLKIVRGIIDRGFNVRLPTEKIKPMAVPVGVYPEMSVRGQKVALGIKVADLAITEDMIWLGAEITIDLPKQAVKALAAGDAKATPAPGATPAPRPVK